MNITTETLIEALDATDLRKELPKNPDHQWKKRDPNKLEGLCIHQSLSWGSLESIAKYHTGPQSHLRLGGVHSISYTIGIRRNGEICVLNDLEDKVWSQGYKDRAGDENATFLSVVNEGFFRFEPGQEEYHGVIVGEPTVQQIQANLFVWNICSKLWDWDVKCIYGHYHFGKKSCPGLTLQSVIESIRNSFNFEIEGEVNRFLKEFGFDSVKDFQLQYSRKTGKDIIVDGIWGPQTKRAALHWANLAYV